MAGDDGEVFMTRSFNVTPKTTEQHLIVRSDKSEAYVTITKGSVRGITLLKLTTDGHKASRGLSATAELLVVSVNGVTLFSKESKCIAAHHLLTENHRSLIHICITPLWNQLPDLFRQPRQSCLDLFIHLSAHLCYHHHFRHPSLLHSFTPGSKPPFSTNPSHLRLLLPTTLPDCLHDNGTELYHAHRFIFSFTF